MGGKKPPTQDEEKTRRETPTKESGADASYAGSKPGRNGARPLTDEEAFAELQRRQRERARRF
jgi:hypothetical protein